MKVRALRACYASGVILTPGRVATLSEADARILIAVRKAEPAPEEDAAPKPKRRGRPRKEIAE